MSISEDNMELILELIQIYDDYENNVNYDASVTDKQENRKMSNAPIVKNEQFPNQCGLQDENLVFNNCLMHTEISEGIQQMDLRNCGNKETFIKPTIESDCTSVLPENSSIVCEHNLKEKKIIKKYEPFMCSVCQKVFSSKDSLKSHAAVHSSKRPFACRMCFAAFKRKSHLLDHDKWVHKKQVRIYPHNKIAIWKAEVGKFSCDKCKEVFANKYELKKHSKIKHENKTCNDCNENFSSLSSFYRHKAQHKGINTPSLCDICGRVFKNKYFFKIHLKNHSNEKEFLCELCGKYFALKCYLDTHMIVHSDSRPFACFYCAKTFRKKDHLIQHIRVHTKKPFSYLFDRGFAQLGDQKKHILTDQITLIEE